MEEARKVDDKTRFHCIIFCYRMFRFAFVGSKSCSSSTIAKSPSICNYTSAQMIPFANSRTMYMQLRLWAHAKTHVIIQTCTLLVTRMQIHSWQHECVQANTLMVTCLISSTLMVTWTCASEHTHGNMHICKQTHSW